MHTQVKSYLVIEVIWKDDDMIELNIEASNNNFSGKTNLYDSSEQLATFAKCLAGYPVDRSELFYQIGEKDSHSYFSMRYYPVGFNGFIGVELLFESNVPTDYTI